jgi:hypothetical protein
METLFLPHTPGEWESILIDWWAHLTPLCLVLAAVVMFIRMALHGRWRRRMARASAFLIGGYAVLMLRVLFGRYNPSDGDGTPLPFFALLYLSTALYFLYALALEWIVPLAWWSVRKVSGKEVEPAQVLSERLDNV